MKNFFRLISPMTGLAVCAATLLLSPAPAVADVTYYFSTLIPNSSSTMPTNPAPWGSATFQDYGANQVLLTIDNTGLSASEFYSQIFFNLDPGLIPANLSFVEQTSSGAFTPPTINHTPGSKDYKADGDGYYDVDFEFAPSGADDYRFNAGDSVTYLITISGGSPLSASSFNCLSAPGGGANVEYAAGHLQGVNDGTASAWTAPIPEPASGALLFLATCLWAGVRRMTR
jgi:hypothetical protein